MFTELTGDAGGSGSTLAAAILACASLSGTIITVVWGSKRKDRRRTDVAQTPPDVLSNSQRLDAHDQILTDLHRGQDHIEATLDAQLESWKEWRTQVNNRLWPPTT